MTEPTPIEKLREWIENDGYPYHDDLCPVSLGGKGGCTCGLTEARAWVEEVHGGLRDTQKRSDVWEAACSKAQCKLRTAEAELARHNVQGGVSLKGCGHPVQCAYPDEGGGCSLCDVEAERDEAQSDEKIWKFKLKQIRGALRSAENEAATLRQRLAEAEKQRFCAVHDQGYEYCNCPTKPTTGGEG